MSGAGSAGFTLAATNVWTNTGTITINSQSALLTTNNVSIASSINYYSNNSGTLTLGDNLTTNQTFAATQGTVNLSTFTLSCGVFSSTGFSTRAIAFGTGQITLTGNAGTIWSMAQASGFTYSGTAKIVSNYAGSTGTRTFLFGSITVPFTVGSGSGNQFSFGTAGTDSVAFSGSVNALDFTGFTGTWAQSTNAMSITSGNLTLVSGMTCTASTGVISFTATSGTQTITSAGKTINPVTINGTGGTTSLADAANINGALTVTLGTFNANNQNVTASSVSIASSASNTVTMGSGTWAVSDVTGTIWSVGSLATINANTSTIALSTSFAVTFAGNGKTYYNLDITGPTAGVTHVITGANTFNQISSSKTVYYIIGLQAGATTTVGTWLAQGSSGNILILGSSSAGTAATLAVTNPSTINYAFIKAIDLSVLNAATVTNSNVINSNNWRVATTSKRWAVLTTTGSNTWTSPSDWATSGNEIHVIGGGGGASGAVTNNIASGAGGGGGGYTKATSVTLAASTSYSYTVGAGGTGSAGGTTNQTGGTGGTSSFTIPITYISSATSVQNTASATISVTVPSVSNGNLMIMIVQSSSVGQTWTTPAGWTASTASGGKAIFYRTASSEPASYTVTKSASTGTADAFIIAYSNATFDTAGTFSANATPSQPAAITVAQANSTIVYWVGRDSAVSVTFTTPTGYTARQADSDATAPGAALFDLAGVAAGSYTAPTTTPSSGTASSVVIAIKPSSFYQATGGAGGASTTTPTSTGGTGGVGSGGTLNYTGGTGGAGATSGTTKGGAGGGGSAGPNGNGANGGAGFGGTQAGGSGGGGNGGGTAGAVGTSGSVNNGGTGGNNSLGTGGGTSGNNGTAGGGGGGAASSLSAGNSGGDGIDIIYGYSSYSYGTGGGGGGAAQLAGDGGAGGLYGGGGSGASTSGSSARAGGAGAQGAVVIGYTGTYVPPVGSTGNFFFLFM